jgi:hypothetical protein
VLPEIKKHAIIIERKKSPEGKFRKKTKYFS